jgi:hypothetical protein
MHKRRPLFLFLVAFTLIYGGLIVPWPGVNDAFGAGVRGWARSIFGSEGPQRVIRFGAYQGDPRLPNDTRIILGNRARARADGSGPVVLLDLDTRGVCYIPLALLGALILATPIPWRRRLVALAWGVFWMHWYLLLIFYVYIEAHAHEASFPEPSPFWRSILEGANYLLIVQIGASFAIPVVIWLLVTFRREDATVLRSCLRS